MSSSPGKTIFLMLKYALKRKLNKFGYAFNKKKKNSKSRNPIRSKRGGAGAAFGLLGLIYFMALGLIFIGTTTKRIKDLNHFKTLTNKNDIPSHLTSAKIHLLDLEIQQHFENVKNNQNNNQSDIEWQLAWDKFYNAIEFKHLNLETNLHTMADSKFTEYYKTGVCPLKSINLSSNNITNNSPYLCLFYVLIAILVCFSLFSSLGFSINELGATDKYYEWLASNALPINSLYLFRVIENAFSNLINWIFLLPALAYLYYDLRGVSYLPIAILIWFSWSLMIGSIQVLTELFFQHYAGLKHAKFFQSICSILATLLMLLFYLWNNNNEIIKKSFLFFSEFIPIYRWTPFFYLPLINKNDHFSIFALCYQILASLICVFLVYHFSRKLTKNGLTTNVTAFREKRKSTDLSELNIKASTSNPIVTFEKLMLFRNKQIFLTV